MLEFYKSSLSWSFLLFLLIVITFEAHASKGSLYDVLPINSLYEFEMLNKNTVRYTQKYKLLLKYEAQFTDKGEPLERIRWPINTNNGKTYECSLPYMNQQVIIEEEEHEATSASIEPFLSPLKGTCIFRMEGWWTYEFCYGKHIRQFHTSQEGKIEVQYYLGKDTGIDTGNPQADHYSETYQYGDTCDLTNKPRKTEVKFYCNSKSETTVITSIKEYSSCIYELKIDTPLICKHPKYSANVGDEIEKILCFENPLPSTEELYSTADAEPLTHKDTKLQSNPANTIEEDLQDIFKGKVKLQVNKQEKKPIFTMKVKDSKEKPAYGTFRLNHEEDSNNQIKTLKHALGLDAMDLSDDQLKFIQELIEGLNADTIQVYIKDFDNNEEEENQSDLKEEL